MGDDSDLVIGFDILPLHSSRSRKRSKYACVVMRDGVVLNEYSSLSRRNLIRLIRELEPTYIATDNIFEIVPDAKSVFRFVKRIPHETRIVQVTGVPPKQVKLKTLARQHNIPIRGKLRPLEAARIAAKLVGMGVGYALECFSEQTEIKVTRGRKMGKGGQSANRYRRKIHSEIQQMTRHVESELKRADIEYDIHLRHSDFGYSSARIVAYAPLPIIRGMIDPKRGGDFNVIVSPIRKRTEFVPLEPKPVPSKISPRYFILGVDPGTTAAICLLNLRGKVHLLESKRALTRADIIRKVYEHGVPIVVATDTTPVPHQVKKIASTLNAEIYEPNKPIAVADKQELAREYSDNVKIGNAHERDALTAAVYAYRSVLSKLEQIDHKIREEQISVERDHLKALVLKGMPMNEAIAGLVREQAEVVEMPTAPLEKKEEPLTQERYDSLREKVEGLEEENELLTDRIEDLERLVEYLQFKEDELSYSLEIVNKQNYWKVKRDREVAKKQTQLRKAQSEVRHLRSEYKKLEERLRRLKGVKKLEMRGDMIAIKTLPHFTRESIMGYSRKVGLKRGDIVLFEDASGGGPQTARILIEQEIRAVIVDTPLSHLAEEELVKAMIPVIDGNSVELQRVDEFAFISRKRFEQKFNEFVKRVREKARKMGEEELVRLVERYQREIDR